MYSAPIFHLKHYVYARPGDRRLGQQLADLAPGGICLPFGWAGPPEVEKLLAEGLITRESPSGHESCARMIQTGRADFFIATTEQAAIALKHAGLAAGALQQGRVLIGTSTLHLIVPKNRPGAVEFIRRFDAALATLPRNAVVDGPGRVTVPRPSR